METSGASVHEASYNAVAGRTAEGRFQCVMTCSCGETRTSSSQVSATQARSNARTAFTRHVKEAETRAREAEEHLAATSAAAEEAARLEAERLAAEEADRLEAERLAAEEAARLEAEEAERLAAEEAAHVDDEPETHESEPEPDEPPASRRASELVVSPALARRARALAMPAVAAAAAVAAIVVAFTGSDEQPEPPGRVGQVAQQQFDEVPSGTPSTGTTGPAPPTGPGSFVQRLREADPVYERPSTRTLVAAGRRTCQDYKAGQDVVQIVATLANRGHLDPAQARTFIRFSGPAFCPQFVKPMTEELDGLDS